MASTVLVLLVGVLVGALALLLWRLRRFKRALDEAAGVTVKYGEDRQRLLEFMHMMTEAVGEALSKRELQQRIVHAAIVCTDATSGCFFERTERDTMRCAAVEGLFPPHRPLSDEAKAALTTRARFIEQVLKPEEFPVSEGVVGRVARTRRGELLVDAEADQTIVKHDDPALMVRSVVVVALTRTWKSFDWAPKCCRFATLSKRCRRSGTSGGRPLADDRGAARTREGASVSHQLRAMICRRT